MPTYDFECSNCGHKVLNEICSIKESEERLCCPACGGELKKLIGAPNIFTTIIPTYPGSKKHKAGYVHQFGNRPAEKTQVGYGGAVSSDHPTGSTKNKD